jgi:hypothetical protein
MKFLSVHTTALMLSLNAVKSRFSDDCVCTYVRTYVLQGIDTRNLIYAFMMQRYKLYSFPFSYSEKTSNYPLISIGALLLKFTVIIFFSFYSHIFIKLKLMIFTVPGFFISVAKSCRS